MPYMCFCVIANASLQRSCPQICCRYLSHLVYCVWHEGPLPCLYRSLYLPPRSTSPPPFHSQAEVEAGRAALQDTRLALNAAEGPGGSPAERQRLREQLAQQAEAVDTASVQVGGGRALASGARGELVVLHTAARSCWRQPACQGSRIQTLAGRRPLSVLVLPLNCSASSAPHQWLCLCSCARSKGGWRRPGQSAPAPTRVRLPAVCAHTDPGGLQAACHRAGCAHAAWVHCCPSVPLCTAVVRLATHLQCLLPCSQDFRGGLCSGRQAL